MTFAAFRSMVHRRRSLAWLLALLLWLPAAQWAAAAHGLVHIAGTASDGPDRPAHLPQTCDTCALAAALGSAAPQSAPTGALLPALAHALAPAPAAPGIVAPSAPVYRSRAPPSLHA